MPELIRSFRGHKNKTTCVAFNPTATNLISGSTDNCLMLWHFKSHLRAFRFAGHTGPVNSVEFSPSGHLVVSASKDRTVRLWHPNV
jgi:centriolar protein POC1